MDNGYRYAYGCMATDLPHSGYAALVLAYWGSRVACLGPATTARGLHHCPDTGQSASDKGCNMKQC